jgi:hypothetical protein
MSTRRLVADVKRTLKYKLRELEAASKPKKRKG